MTTDRHVPARAVDADHPANRPVEPEHPLILDGRAVPGDLAMMLRCMFEELLLLGTSPAQLRAMTFDPNYQALYAARRALGGDMCDTLLDQTVARIGCHRYRDVEHRGDIQPATLSIRATG